jgi:biopolymer transport protein ExbD
MRARHVMKKPDKPNLIPIMDAVFIFIFFLLMSAQFIDVFEIGSSVPMVREVTQDKIEKDPLNLVLEVTPSEIIVRKGKDAQQVASFNDNQWDQFRGLLFKLKQQYPKERIAMLRPQGKVAFHRLVKVIDHAKEDKNSKTKMFEEVVFDGKKGAAK